MNKVKWVWVVVSPKGKPIHAYESLEKMQKEHQTHFILHPHKLTLDELWEYEIVDEDTNKLVARCYRTELKS